MPTWLIYGKEEETKEHALFYGLVVLIELTDEPPLANDTILLLKFFSHGGLVESQKQFRL